MDGSADASPGDASTDAGSSVFGHCATDTILRVPGGGGELGMAGSVTLAQSGSLLTVSYGGEGGVFDASLSFTQTSANSATLTPGQQIDGISVPCAPTDFAPSVAQLQSGSLTFNAGVLYLSVEGIDEAVDAGAGCSNPGGSASVLITCRDVAGIATSGVDGGTELDAATLGSNFVGTYTCTSDVVNAKGLPPMTYESDNGGNAWNPTGQLTITETGGVLAVDYANDCNPSSVRVVSAA